MAPLLLSLLLLSSCALLRPNPNREALAEEASLTLEPFTTDYCSEWPDGEITDPKLWAECCFTHDLHYWLGGTESEREVSDINLQECVKMTGASLNSFLMYIGVRIGGLPGNTSWAWGYGWTKDRKYFELNDEEKLRAKILLEKFNKNKNADEQKIISTFIEKNL